MIFYQLEVFVIDIFVYANIKSLNRIPIIAILKMNVSWPIFSTMLFPELSSRAWDEIARLKRTRGRIRDIWRTRFDEFSVSTGSSSVYRPLDEVSSIAERWSMPSRRIRLLLNEWTNDRTIDRLLVRRTRRTDWFRFKQHYCTWSITHAHPALRKLWLICHAAVRTGHRAQAAFRADPILPPPVEEVQETNWSVFDKRWKKKMKNRFDQSPR